MKNKISFFVGLLYIIIGIVVLLMNTSVTSWNFYLLGHVNSGNILLVFLILSIVYAVIKHNTAGILMVVGVIALMILFLIMGINLNIMHMSAFSIVLILGLIGFSIELVIKSLL